MPSASTARCRAAGSAPSAASAITTTARAGSSRRWPRSSSGCSRGIGLHLLRNERVDVAGLQLIGLEDFWGPSFDPAPVLAGLPAGAPAIVLSHNPDAADEPVWGAFRRLDPRRPHPRRPVQAAVPAAAAAAGAQPPLHRGRVRGRRRPQPLHQPRPRPPAPGALQRPPGDHGLHADPGGVTRRQDWRSGGCGSRSCSI